MISINKSIPENFEEQVLKNGEAIAIKTFSGFITFNSLNKRANQVAREILSHKKTSKKQVSLLFGHGIDMVVGILAVLKADLTYIPLDSSYPEDRLKFMFENSESFLLLTNKENSGIAKKITNKSEDILLVEECNEANKENLLLSIDTSSLAYILYTSGSTGKPKGVCQSHRNVLHHMRVWVENLKITNSDRLSVQSAYSWDSAGQDIFGSLLSGACLYPVNVNTASLNMILDWYISEGVSVWHSTLPLYRSISKIIVSESKSWTSLRVAALGGDPIFKTDVALFRDSFNDNALLVNAYGATESSSALMNNIYNNEKFDLHVVPLGKTVRDTDSYLENEIGERVTIIGEEGEVIIKSEFISPGYWGINESEFKNKFKKDFKNPSIIKYHTGDIGKITEDGSIALIGRNDFQVKIRGIRVNLSEIEALLKQHPFVADAIVKAFDDKWDIRFLAAYIVVDDNNIDVTLTHLRSFLIEKIPDFMVPSRFIFMKELPLTSNKKIDRGALPYPDKSRPQLDNAYLEAASERENLIVSIWKEILDLNQIGIHDNFFDLGGNSIRLANVNIQLNKVLPESVTMVDLYRLPTVYKLAQFLAKGEKEDAGFVKEGEERANKRLKIRKR